MTHQGSPATAPAPYGPVPSERQLLWHKHEFYGFLHFTTNTFTDKEWGYGDESPDVFAPTALDADQIVGTAADAGMAGLILTCKHHDGFCLWPSKYTEHSVKNSPWRGGKRDVVKEISDACASQGLQFGVYLSPWDRNHPAYGTAEYVSYYRNQLCELLTGYGPVFEVWFDGANGGDGYYGGACEARKIDKHSYYDWERTWAIVRDLQPGACLFSDVGPDIRWVGNEKGVAGDTCWAAYTPHGREGKPPAPGATAYEEGENGHRDGQFWMPAEADVSIRPGWFYHSAEDDSVRTPENLLDLYFRSVGRGAAFNLNLPPDRRGLIHEQDVESLRAFRRRRDAILDHDLARHAQCTAGNTRGNLAAFAPANVIDGNTATYWATDDEAETCELALDFSQAITFNVIGIREFLPLGQRIDRFAIDVDDSGTWREWCCEAAIGARRLIRGEKTTTRRVRFRVVEAPVCPAISEIGVYCM